MYFFHVIHKVINLLHQKYLQHLISNIKKVFLMGFKILINFMMFFYFHYDIILNSLLELNMILSIKIL